MQGEITASSGDRCYDFKNIFAESVNIGVYIETTASFLLKFDHNNGFRGKTPFFPPKIGKTRRTL
jgi:hypothetical protein